MKCFYKGASSFLSPFCLGKQKQLQNLEDACDDIMLLDDADSHLIPYQIGDVFISHSLEETQEMLEEAKVCLELLSV